MATDTFKIARENRKAAIALADRQLVCEVIGNPVLQIVTAYLVIEYAQKRGWVGSIAGTTAEVGVIGAVTLQQLARSPELLKAAAQASEQGAELIGKVVPLLAAAA